MVLHSPPCCRSDIRNSFTIDRRDQLDGLTLRYKLSGAVPCEIAPMVDGLAAWGTTFQPECKLKLRHFERHTCHSLTSLHGCFWGNYTRLNPDNLEECHPYTRSAGPMPIHGIGRLVSTLTQSSMEAIILSLGDWCSRGSVTEIPVFMYLKLFSSKFWTA